MTETSTAVAKVVEYTPIKELLSLSWERLKMTWKNLLLLSLLIYAVSFVGVLLISMIVLGGGLISGFSNAQSVEAGLMSAITTMAPVAIVLIVVYVLVMLFVSIVSGAAMLLLVAKAEEKPSLGSAVKQGMTLFVPMLLTSLLVAFLTIGGWMLFVIPGIIIAIFMSFATYEVVLNNQKYLQAMKNSATIVKQHFSALFVRVLIIMLIAIGIGLVEGILTSIFKEVPVLLGLLNLVKMVVQVMLSWFIVSFMYLIYEEVRKKTDFNQQASMTWMWIVSIIGWILGVLLMMAMGVAIANLVKTGMLKNLMDQGSDRFENEMQLEDQTLEMDAESLIKQYGGELSPEEQQLMREIINSQESE